MRVDLSSLRIKQMLLGDPSVRGEEGGIFPGIEGSKNSPGPRVEREDIFASIGEEKDAGGDFRPDSMNPLQRVQGFFIR